MTLSLGGLKNTAITAAVILGVVFLYGKARMYVAALPSLV